MRAVAGLLSDTSHLVVEQRRWHIRNKRELQHTHMHTLELPYSTAPHYQPIFRFITLDCFSGFSFFFFFSRRYITISHLLYVFLLLFFPPFFLARVLLFLLYLFFYSILHVLYICIHIYTYYIYIYIYLNSNRTALFLFLSIYTQVMVSCKRDCIFFSVSKAKGLASGPEFLLKWTAVFFFPFLLWCCWTVLFFFLPSPASQQLSKIRRELTQARAFKGGAGRGGRDPIVFFFLCFRSLFQFSWDILLF